MSDFMDWLLGQGGQKFGGNKIGGNTFGGQTYGGNQYGTSAVPEVPPEVAPATDPNPVDPPLTPATPYGGNTFGGNTFGGNKFGGATYGGNTFGGNKFGASAPPLAPTPGTIPDAPNPADLPNIAGMIQSIKNAPPQPAAPAAVSPAVPPMPAPQPVGAGAGLAPAGPDLAANAPAATSDPTPLAPDAGPAAPSDTPAGRSLLDRIMGSDDASTKDSRGLTEADRHASGFDALAKLGFGIMAASMPQAPGQRAATIAQLGSIPASMLKQQAAQIGMQAQAQQVKLRQQQLDAKKAGLEYMKSPEFQETLKSLPPQMQGVLKAAAAAGDIGAIAHIQQSMMPKMSGNTMFNPATGQATNTITGITTGGNGQPVSSGGAPAASGGSAAPGSAPAQDPSGMSYDENYIQQNVPPQFQEQVRAIAEGRDKLPGVTDRNGVGIQLNTWAHNANKSLDRTTYDRRDKAQKDYAPSGVVGSGMIALNTFAQHTNELRQAADGLDNTGLPVWNSLKNRYGTATGDDPATRFNQVRDMATRELDTLVSKGHATVSETGQIRQHLNDAQSPKQLDAVISQMGRLAKDRLQAVTQQGQNALGKKGMQSLDEQLQNPVGLQALNDIEANPIKGSPRAAQYDALRQQFGLPADADVAHYEYRKLPDGTVQRKKK